MSVITIPAAMAASIGAQSWGQLRYDEQSLSGATGATFTRVLAPPRWRTTLGMPRWTSAAQYGAWEAFALKLRGGINHAAVYDFLTTAPSGTMRGAPTTGFGAAGATTITLRNAVGTLEPGDALQFGTGVGTSQLVKVVESATATVTASATSSWSTTTPSAATWSTTAPATATWSTAGTATITFEPPLRIDFDSGTAVVWDKPVAYFKLKSEGYTLQAVPNGPSKEGMQLELLEDWSLT